MSKPENRPGKKPAVPPGRAAARTQCSAPRWSLSLPVPASPRPRCAEEGGPRCPPAGIVGVEVRDVDQLFDDVAKASPGVRQDGLQTFTGPAGLGGHAPGGHGAIRRAACQSGSKQDAAGVDAHCWHESSALFDRILCENVLAVHRLLLNAVVLSDS